MTEIEIARGKAYTVDRGRGGAFAGGGLLRGLGIVFNHFVKSYTATGTSKRDNMGTFTTQYPEERVGLPETYRNMPILLYDDASGQELCTSCFQCERICPPQVIHITQAKDPSTGKAVPAIDDFVIEYDACMSCGLCAEVCPFDAIKMDHTFELSTDDHTQLTVHREALNKPVSYYEAIAPTLWEAAKAGAYKKLQGSLKRRTGLIGVAPQMHHAHREQATAAPAPVASVAPATPAAPVTPSEAAAPAPATQSGAASGASTSDEKKARLEAIRAAKAAQKAAEQEVTDGAPAAAAPEVAPPVSPTAAQASASSASNMSDEKKARLEAIRAAKAAQKAAEQGAADGAPAVAAPEIAPPVSPTAAQASASSASSMSDEKKARLEAIRAAKAAQKAAEQAQQDEPPQR